MFHHRQFASILIASELSKIVKTKYVLRWLTVNQPFKNLIWFICNTIERQQQQQQKQHTHKYNKAI